MARILQSWRLSKKGHFINTEFWRGPVALFIVETRVISDLYSAATSIGGYQNIPPVMERF